MNTYAMAEAYIKDAERSLKEAVASLEEEAFHRCVRRAQECAELSLKGMLRLLGIEYPKSHDVSAALDALKTEVKIPDWLKSRIDSLKTVSVKLSMQRGPAFYGDERAFIPPEQLYSKEEAEEALKMAREALEAAKKLLESRK